MGEVTINMMERCWNIFVQHFLLASMYLNQRKSPMRMQLRRTPTAKHLTNKPIRDEKLTEILIHATDIDR